MDAAGGSFHFLKTKLDHCWHWFSRRSLPDSSQAVGPPNPSVSPALDQKAAQASEIEKQDPESPDSAPAGVMAISFSESPDSGGQSVLAVPPANPLYKFDWGGMVIGFCLTSAVEIALQSLQPQIKIPLLVHLLSLAMVFTFSSIFLSIFFSPDLFPRISLALRLVAMLSVFIAFFLAITVPFSRRFKLISWSIFALSLLFIVYAIVAASGRLHHR